MKNKKYTICILCLFYFQFAFAQSELPEGFGDYRTIEEPEWGKMYTQVYQPPTFKKVIFRDSVLLLEKNPHLIEGLEEGKDYKVKIEIVEVHPAYTIWEFETPKIDTIRYGKPFIVDRICEEIEPMPKYENQIIQERELVLEYDIIFVPWPLTNNMRNQDFANPKYEKSHIFYRFIEINSVYVTIQKQVFQKDGKWWTETIADTVNIKHESYYSEPGVKSMTRHIPAVIDTFHHVIILKNGLKQLSQSHFSTIYKHIIDDEDYFSEWREVMMHSCCENFKSIQNLQKALVERGYKLYINTTLDEATAKAIIHFQKANNLPVGTLNGETFKALGVKQ